MYSPRGVMMLAHNTHDVQVGKRHVHANRLAGVDNEWLSPEEAKAFRDAGEVNFNPLADGDNRAFLIFTTCVPWSPTSPPRSLTSGAALQIRAQTIDG